MSFFPSAIATLRALVNRPGAEYNEANTKTFYAEDHNSLIDEVVAIETELGTNPKGSHDSVADRLGDAEASIATKQASLGYTPEDVTNKDTTVTLGTSDSKYPSQKAVKSFVENAGGGATKFLFMGFRNAAENSGSGGTIKMNNVISDPNNNYNTSTGVYTCPVAGYYAVTGRASFSATTARAFVSIFKNGVSALRGIDLTVTNAVLGSIVTGIVKCNAGDTLTLEQYCSITTAPYENDMPTSQRYLHIHLLSV